MMHLDIIIPTLNEEGYIGSTLEKVYARAADINKISIWISDCASSDGTLKEAAKYPVNIPVYETSPYSRASALNFGAEQASGDVLLFLHADVTVPFHFDRLIIEALSNPGIVGGAFNLGIDHTAFVYRLLTMLNSFRYHVVKRYFGDQAIFVTRQAFINAGKFPDVHLMEDTLFCKRLWKIGRLKLLKEEIIISPRRFEECGILKTFLFDSWCTILDALNISSEKYASAYKENNLSRGNKTH